MKTRIMVIMVVILMFSVCYAQEQEKEEVLKTNSVEVIYSATDSLIATVFNIDLKDQCAGGRILIVRELIESIAEKKAEKKIRETLYNVYLYTSHHFKESRDDPVAFLIRLMREPYKYSKNK